MYALDFPKSTFLYFLHPSTFKSETRFKKTTPIIWNLLGPTKKEGHFFQHSTAQNNSLKKHIVSKYDTLLESTYIHAF